MYSKMIWSYIFVYMSVFSPSFCIILYYKVLSIVLYVIQ